MEMPKFYLSFMYFKTKEGYKVKDACGCTTYAVASTVKEARSIIKKLHK